MTSSRLRADESQVVASHMLDIGGLRVRAHVQGEGPALLFLNGLTRPLESWMPVLQALPGRTIVTFDAPGVGGSPTPILPLSIRRLARVALAVLDDAGQDGPVDVLGFSHGGAVAQELAIDAPERVRRLMLVSTSCGVGATPGSQTVLRSLRPSEVTSQWPRPDALGTLWHFLAISGWSSIPFLGALTMPTLVISGAYDRVVPPANSRLLAQRIPGAELVILEGGHDLPGPRTAEALADTVTHFLNGASAA